MSVKGHTSLALSALVICASLATTTYAAPPPDQSPTAAKLHPVLLQRFSESSDTVKAWVFFTDKGFASTDVENAAIQDVAANYNQRAVQRRLIRSTPARRGEPIFTARDLPVCQTYVDAVTNTGARVHVSSRWLNAVSVHATRDQADQIAALPFVDRLEAVRRTQPIEALNVCDIGPAPAPAGDGRSLDYGLSQPQLEQINLIALHDAGYTGQGVVVGILDTGFRRTHQAFNQPFHAVSVLAEYDFVDDDPIAAPEDGDPSSQHEHGTLILGCLGAYKPGDLVGGAYDASFVLAKTEDTTQEVPAEEDAYVAGLEFIESHGADMETSSLGYIDWYTQSQLDGQTAVTTIAVNISTSLGIHHCNAAGNEYHDSSPTTSSLIAPADAFQVITCGAVSSSGSIASFSSDGPTADGRVKPEVLARGVTTHTVSPFSDSTYTTADGTSLSTPLVACAVACLVQAHPSWTVDQMREYIFETADYYVEHETYDPLYVLGYGIVDAFAAHQHEPLSVILLDEIPEYYTPGQPATLNLQITDGSEQLQPGSPTLYFRGAPGSFTSVPLTDLGNGHYQATLPTLLCDDAPEFYFSATSTLGTIVKLPATAPFELYSAGVAFVADLFNDDFETDLGWTVEDTDIITGSWERGTPAGTGERFDPPADFDGSGRCFLTDNGPGNTDVDGGPTRLISPAIDLAAAHEPVLEYARWWGNDDQDDDPFDVEISNDDGATWILVEHVVNIPHGWVAHAVNLNDYLTPTAQVRVRFSCMDVPNNSVDEGGVDAVRVRDIWCSLAGNGDCNCDGTVDYADIDPFVAALSCVGGNPDCWPPAGVPTDCPWLNADCDGDGSVTYADIDAFVASIGSCR